MYFPGDNKESPGADKDGEVSNSLSEETREERRRLPYHVTCDTFRLLIYAAQIFNLRLYCRCGLYFVFFGTPMLLVSLFVINTILLYILLNIVTRTYNTALRASFCMFSLKSF